MTTQNQYASIQSRNREAERESVTQCYPQTGHFKRLWLLTAVPQLITFHCTCTVGTFTDIVTLHYVHVCSAETMNELRVYTLNYTFFKPATQLYTKETLENTYRNMWTNRQLHKIKVCPKGRKRYKIIRNNCGSFHFIVIPGNVQGFNLNPWVVYKFTLSYQRSFVL